MASACELLNGTVSHLLPPLLPDSDNVYTKQESRQNDSSIRQVVLCSTERKADVPLRMIKDEPYKIIPCSDKSIFEQPSPPLSSFTTMYLILDSALAKIMLSEGRLYDSVHEFFKAVNNSNCSSNNNEKRMVHVVNKFDVDDRQFFEIFYQLPGGCTKEIKDMLLTIEPQETVTMEVDSEPDCGDPPTDDEYSQEDLVEVNLSTGQERDNTGEKDGQNSVSGDSLSEEEEEKPIGSSSVNFMIGSHCTMNITPSTSQFVTARQDGSENIMNFTIVPSTEASKLEIIVTTDPNSPRLEEGLVQEIDGKKEVLNIKLKSSNAQIVSVSKGSVVIEIDVKPGQTMDSKWIESIVEIIFDSDLKAIIPQETQLHLNIESNLVMPIDGHGQNVDLASALGDVLQNRFVDRHEYDAKVKELQILKQETAAGAISLGKSTVPIDELKCTLERAVTNGIESESDDCIGITLSLLELVAKLHDEDLWTYAVKHPQLFSVGGVFYKQVERDIGLFHERRFQLPSFMRKVFLYNVLSDRIELCIDRKAYCTIGDYTEETRATSSTASDWENLKRVVYIMGEEELAEFFEPDRTETKDSDCGIAGSDKEHIVAKDGLERREEDIMVQNVVPANREEYVSQFILALHQADEKKAGYKGFLDILDDRPGDSPQDEKRAQKFEMLLLLLQGSLQDLIIPSEIIDHLKPILGDRDYELVLNIERRSSPHDACNVLFTAMQRKTPKWALHFLEAVYNGLGPRILAKITDDYRNIETASINDVDDDDDGDDDGDDDVGDEGDDKGPELDVVHGRGGGTPDLNLRNYQKELAENAVQGRNTIICAPTGSGKTRVSLHVILKHLEQADPDKKRKVVFLARTVPVVTQQFNACTHFLAPMYKVTKRIGGDESSMYLHQLLQYFDIVVMTPQILVNLLKDGKIKSLSVFSMIVLDECHDTRKGEPYNHIMLHYLKEKHKVTKRAQKTATSQLPQIVGLTASVGVEKATADEEAVNNILSLMASMDTPYLSTVENHLDELRRIVPVPEEKFFSLQENWNDPARIVIENVMAQIEDMMLDYVVLNDRTVDSLLMKRPRERHSQPYGQWAVMMKNAAQMVETGGSDGVFEVDVCEDRAEKARSLFVLSDQLFRYNAALEIHNKVRIRDVIQYLTKELGHICLRRDGVDIHVRCEKQLQELFSETKKHLMRYEQSHGNDRRHTNPNLTILSNKLHELVSEKGSDSRIIIFVRTRATCEALVSWFNEDEHIPKELRNLKASMFTGAGSKGQEGGMTQIEQEKVLSKFRDGTVKVLVATSVAEEGLDIPECNIILRYDHVGNEITTLQTRGRSRKAGGTSVLLGSTRTCEKEMLNVARADMMNRALMDIKNMPHDRILRIIVGFQEQILNEEAIKEMVRSQKQRQKVATRFTLLCSTCRNFCVDGKDLRLLGNNQHIVLDTTFRERVNLHRFKNPNTQYADINITGSIQCQKCHGPWGVMFLHKGMSFISLAIKYFNVMNQDTKDQLHFKSWKSFPFRISEITNAEIRRYSGAPDQDSSDEEMSLVSEWF